MAGLAEELKIRFSTRDEIIFEDPTRTRKVQISTLNKREMEATDKDVKAIFDAQYK
jgi:hypothetical protein